MFLYTQNNSNLSVSISIILPLDQAKLVYDVCIQKTQISDSNGSYYYEHTYNYDYLEDFQDLYPDEGPRHVYQRCVQVFGK